MPKNKLFTSSLFFFCPSKKRNKKRTAPSNPAFSHKQEFFHASSPCRPLWCCTPPHEPTGNAWIWTFYVFSYLNIISSITYLRLFLNKSWIKAKNEINIWKLFFWSFLTVLALSNILNLRETKRLSWWLRLSKSPTITLSFECCFSKILNF